MKSAAAVRFVFACHRWAGVALSLLMLLWCLSGFVMMYVPYPGLGEAERVAGLAPLDWRGCCTAPRGVATPFAVEMLAGQPVLRTGGRSLDLRSGMEVKITDAAALAAAGDFARGHGLAGGAPHVETVGRDQWTVSGAFNADRPLHKVMLNDHAGTEIYVSGGSGVVRQRTDAATRFWNYLGAVPHWLYFTQLRRDVGLWSGVVIWTSLAGVLLIAAGLYIGVRQWLRARRAGRATPYRGLAAWHHVPGLLFGLFLLTWVFSGFLSMNPWGLLEGKDGWEAAALEGRPPVDAPAVLAALAQRGASFVSIQSAPLHGTLYLLAWGRDGTTRRLDAQGHDAPLTDGELDGIAARLKARDAPRTRLTDGDDYYFSHDGEAVRLPVVRMIAVDGTRYYVDAVSGQLRQSFDADGRGYRWLQQGLHRLDFNSVWRARPLWDLVMLVLLAGATLVAGSGVVMAARYLLRRTAKRGTLRGRVF